MVSSEEVEKFVNSKLDQTKHEIKELLVQKDLLLDEIRQKEQLIKEKEQILEQRLKDINFLNQKVDRKNSDIISLNTALEKSSQLHTQDGRLIHVSHEIVYNYIDKLMQDPEHNMGSIPDFVEKPVKAYISTLLLSLVKECVKNTSMNWMDHTIGVSIIPNVKRDSKE